MSDEEARRYNVLFEQMSGSVQALAEGHTEVIKQLACLSHEVQSNKREMLERFDRIETRFDGIEGRFDNLESKVDGIGDRLLRVEQHVGINGADASKKRSRKPRKQ